MSDEQIASEIEQFHGLARLTRKLDKEVIISADALISVDDEILELEAEASHLRGLLRRVSKAWWLPEICCEDNDTACDDCKLLRELAAAIAEGE